MSIFSHLIGQAYFFNSLDTKGRREDSIFKCLLTNSYFFESGIGDAVQIFANIMYYTLTYSFSF